MASFLFLYFLARAFPTILGALDSLSSKTSGTIQSSIFFIFQIAKKPSLATTTSEKSKPFLYERP